MSNNLAMNEFETVKELVEYTLGKYPYTRSNDTSLFFQCCRVLGADTLEQAERLKLNIVTVHKIRQVIQNKEGKFLPSKETTENRKIKETEVREYMKSYI